MASRPLSSRGGLQIGFWTNNHAKNNVVDLAALMKTFTNKGLQLLINPVFLAAESAEIQKVQKSQFSIPLTTRRNHSPAH